MVKTLTIMICDCCGTEGIRVHGNYHSREATAISIASRSGWSREWVGNELRDYCELCSPRSIEEIKLKVFEPEEDENECIA